MPLLQRPAVLLFVLALCVPALVGAQERFLRGAVLSLGP